MKIQARNRILSLLVALALVVVPLSAGAMAAELGAIANPENDVPQNGVVLPSTEGLEQPLVFPERTTNTPVRVRTSAGPAAVEFRPGHRDLGDIDGQTGTLTRSGGSFALNDGNTVSVGDTHTLNMWDGALSSSRMRSLPVIAAAVNDVCVVWVQQSSPTGNTAQNQFLPQGGTNAKANAIANEFKNQIYAKFSSPSSPYYATAPRHVPGATGQVHIVMAALFETAPDKNASTYVAGYFDPYDLMSAQELLAMFPGENPSEVLSLGNQDAIVYMDITDGKGAAKYNASLQTWASTLAHEYFHLLSDTAFNGNLQQNGPAASGDPDGTTLSVWMEEGLAGLADYIYSGGTMASDHYTHLINNNFRPGVGYVPTGSEWNYASATGNYVLTNYGASAAQMLELYSTYQGNMIQEIVAANRSGYYNSMDTVARLYGVDSFDKFFDSAIVRMALDDTLINSTLWASRQSGGNYAGIQTMTLTNGAGSVTTDLGGRRHYAQTYLSNAVGAEVNAVNVTVPNNGAAYYIVYPKSAVNVSSNDDWNKADKTYGALKAGDTTSVTIGTNNRFAIVAVSHSTAVGTGVVTVQPGAASAITPGDVTVDPQPAKAGDNVTVKVDITTDGMNDGVKVQATIADADKEAISGIASVEETLVDNKASFTLTYDNASSGTHYVYFSSDEAGVAYAPFVVYLNPQLANPADGETGVDPELSEIVIAFDAAVEAADGTVSVSGYSAEVTSGYISGSKLTVPVSALKSSGGTLVMEYGDTYEVSISAGAVVDKDGNENLSQIIGSFTIDNEPDDPTVVPGSLTIARGDSADIAVYFGAKGEYNSASLSVSDDSVISLSTDTVETSGERVSVTGNKAGSATISIGFSGNGDAEYVKTVDVTVTGGNDGGGTRPPVTTPGGGSGGGGSSSGGKSGGGGGSKGGGQQADGNASTTTSTTTTTSTSRPVDTATATTEAEKAVRNALANGQSTGTVTLQNYSDVSLATMKAMAAAAQQAGGNVLVNADTVVNGKVIVRITFDPAKATKDIKLTGSLTGANVSAVKAVFGQYFSNSVEIVNFAQADDFGMEVRVAAKLDLSALQTASPVIYAYNRTTNVYTYNKAPSAAVDANGYLWYSTTLAGNTVVTNNMLTAK